MIGEASQKTHDELSQRLAKLKARHHPRNALKRLPGYGNAWFYYKKADTTSEGTTRGTLAVENTDVMTFLKKLRTRPPLNEAEEDFGEVVQGPGFEYPNEKESAKCVKHWAKRFKQWQPPESLSTALTVPKRVIRFKPLLPSNEVEFEGKRYKRVEGREEMASMQQRGIPLIEKIPPTLHDARFHAEVLKEESSDVQCSFMVAPSDAPPENTAIKDVISDYAVSEIYAPFPLASKMVMGMKKHLAAHGQADVAAGLRVELASKEEDPDEVNQSHLRRPLNQTTEMKLDEGDEASIYM